MKSKTLLERQRAIDVYDLSFVRAKIADEGKLEDEDLPKIETELRRFLKLVLTHEGPLAMIDRRVDEFWHTFILFTPQYWQFCDEAMGFYVHHQPRTSTTPVSEVAISNFVEAYTSAFGHLDAFWLERLDPDFVESIARGRVPKTLTFQWSGWVGRL